MDIRLLTVDAGKACFEIADRPTNADAAIRFFETLMDEQVARLEELLELHEEIAGE